MKNWDVSKDLINHQGKQMRSVWSIPLTPKNEKLFGKHPTQKPIELVKRLVAAATKEGDTVLDPFMGSGTTGVVCKRLNRKFIGIDFDKKFTALAYRRIGAVNV